MEGLQVNWGDVIRAAAENPLGIVALVVLVLAGMAYAFFRKEAVPVKLAVFAGLAVGLGTLVGVMLHERSGLEQTVSDVKALTAAANSVESGVAAADSSGGSSKQALLAEVSMLSTTVESKPGLKASPRIVAAQNRLAPRRAAMLPRKDPGTGEIQPAPQALDGDTKDAARELAQSLKESFQGKSAFELRKLLSEKPVE
jgi:hypothetical protein